MLGRMITVLRWFFFFKQKTADEMRISDWSSDVCSSDLPRAQRIRPSLPVALDMVDTEQRLADLALAGPGGERVMDTQQHEPSIEARETVRPSGRDRVCQYV